MSTTDSEDPPPTSTRPPTSTIHRRPRASTWAFRAGSIAALVVVLVLVLRAVIETSSPSSTGSTSGASAVLVVGDRAPTNFVLHELGSSTTSALGQLLANKRVVVNFFASWCTACAAEMTNFGRVARSSGGGVTFVGIDTNETNPSRMLTILNKAQVGYRVLSDTGNLSVSDAYGITNLPSTFFIAPSGKITAEVLGYESAAKLRRELRLLDAASG